MKLECLIPMLPVKHLPRSLEFYQRLGFEVENQKDAWGWAMIRNGECRLMLDQSINVAPAAPRQGVLYLYPENIAEYHRQVRERGVPVPELEVTFYGLTEFRLEDPDGNRLWIGQDRSAAAAT